MNRYKEMRKKNEQERKKAQAKKEQVAKTEAFESVNPADAEDAFAGFDVVVSDDDPWTAVESAAATVHREAETVRLEAEAKSVGDIVDERNRRIEEARVERGGFEAGDDSSRLRPKQDPASKTMTGVVTEPPKKAPEPEPTPKPKKAPEPKRPEPPAPEEPMELTEDEELQIYADLLEDEGVIPPIVDYIADIKARETRKLAEQERLEDARQILRAERLRVERERQQQEYEQYLAERVITLVAKVKGVDQWYDVALASYVEQGWGDKLPENIVRAIYWHPETNETWEIEDEREQAQARAKAFADRKKALRAKKGDQKGRKDNSGGKSRR